MTDIVERLRTGACCEGEDCGRVANDRDGVCAIATMRKAAADEIARLRVLSQNNAHSWDALVKECDALRSGLILVRGIIVEGAGTGFNCHDGDWAQRLFESQAATHAALNIQQRQEP